MGLISRLFGRQLGDETAGDRSAWLTAAVQQQGERLVSDMRSSMRAAARSFEAAETPAWTASWSSRASDINEALSRDLPAMRNRATALARDNEWAVRYLGQLDDNVLGETGIALQMMVRRGDQVDKAANAELEQHWSDWGERGACEVTRQLSWRECESLLLGCIERKGEILYRMRPGSGPFGFQVQLLRPELLDITLRRQWQGHRVRMGVEIDDEGAPVAYWLLAAKAGDSVADADIVSVGKHVRVPADQIRHHFVRTEVDQLRGIPGLAIGARRLWLLADFEQAASVASSNAAKRQGFFVSPTGDAPPGIADTLVSSVLEIAVAQGKTLTPEEMAALTAAAQKFATTVPGQFDTIPQGYDFRPFESKWPDISADGYIKGHVRAWSAARGVSYHTLGNDLESVNYSSAQVGIGDERNRFRAWQRDLISWVHHDVAREVLRRAPLYRSALRPSLLDSYLAGIGWRPRTWAPIDPLKASEAEDIALRNRSTTRRRIWLAKGLDPDDMQAEVLEEEAIFGRLDAPADAGTSKRSRRHDEADKPVAGGGG